MKALLPIGLVIAIEAGLLTGQLIAQTNPDPSAHTEDTSHQTSSEPSQPSPEVPAGSSRQPEYAPALDGGGLLPMNTAHHAHLLVGSTTSGGWDSNPDNLARGAAAFLYTISPYVGLQAGTSTTQFLLQYLPTFTFYNGYSGNAMQMASAKFVGNATPRLTWTATMEGSHGQDSVRLIAPTQSIPVGGVPGTGPPSASYLPNAGTVTAMDGSMALHYNLSERDFLGLDLADSFNSMEALEQRNSVAIASLRFTHGISSKLGIIAYQQTSQYYGDISCTSFGGGIGVQWQPRQNAAISLKGGPQLDAPACKSQQGFDYNASFAYKLPGRSQVYLLAGRQPVTDFLGPGLWQDSVSGGYSRQFNRANAVSMDVGFVTSSSLKNVSSYQGTFINSSYTHSLHAGLSIACTYRRYSGESGQTSFTRGLALVSVTWTPNSPQISQQR